MANGTITIGDGELHVDIVARDDGRPRMSLAD
jgi:hypothetical protein